MAKLVIPEAAKESLAEFLKKNRSTDLITAYLFFIQKKLGMQPILFIRDKMIYQSQEELIKTLESQGKLWRETEIKIQFGQQSVNAQTKKIYICPFTGKVFGDNTHPNPQDAIYDWVGHCPQNTERSGGLKVKRFFVSEDPEVIKNYIVKGKDPITKVVFSSAVTGKLFNSKAAVIDDFITHHLKPVALYEVPGQNRFQIEERLLAFIQTHLDEKNIEPFVEALGELPQFAPYVAGWLEEPQQDASSS